MMARACASGRRPPTSARSRRAPRARSHRNLEGPGARGSRAEPEGRCGEKAPAPRASGPPDVQKGPARLSPHRARQGRLRPSRQQTPPTVQIRACRTLLPKAPGRPWDRSSCREAEAFLATLGSVGPVHCSMIRPGQPGGCREPSAWGCGALPHPTRGPGWTGPQSGRGGGGSRPTRARDARSRPGGSATRRGPAGGVPGHREEGSRRTGERRPRAPVGPGGGRGRRGRRPQRGRYTAKRRGGATV